MKLTAHEGRKTTEESNYRRFRLRSERGVLEYLREFTVSSALLTYRDLLNGIRTGIGPEVFAWKTADGNYTGPALTEEKEAYYQVSPTCVALYYVKIEITRKTDTTHTMTTLITTSDPRS